MLVSLSLGFGCRKKGGQVREREMDEETIKETIQVNEKFTLTALRQSYAI
jgi:hypothetical protein